jgi:hypothetical protein
MSLSFHDRQWEALDVRNQLWKQMGQTMLPLELSHTSRESNRVRLVLNAGG